MNNVTTFIMHLFEIPVRIKMPQFLRKGALFSHRITSSQSILHPFIKCFLHQVRILRLLFRNFLESSAVVEPLCPC